MIFRNVLPLVLLAAHTHAATIRVAPATGIKAALASAVDGDTLRIQQGLYKEHDITITKSLTLLGEGMPVFDGEGKYQVFIIKANSVVVEGIGVRNTGRSSMTDMAAIRIVESQAVRISGCDIQNATYGVYLQASHDCAVNNNRIIAHAKDELGSGNGIHAWKCSRLAIGNNHISGHRDGIYFEFVTDSRITGNTSEGNIRYGLHFMFSHNDVYSYNVFKRNGAGVAVMYTKGVTMYRNLFYHNWGEASYGILLKDIADSRIVGNRFLKNTTAIYAEGASRVRIDSNLFRENGWALKVLANSDNNIFERNNFEGNSFDAATNGTLALNTFRQNYWDKYDGYDLGRDGTGDVPYHPVSLYAMVTEQMPTAMILYRSFLTSLLNSAEKVVPSIIPDQWRDDAPVMKKWKLWPHPDLSPKEKGDCGCW